MERGEIWPLILGLQLKEQKSKVLARNAKYFLKEGEANPHEPSRPSSGVGTYTPNFSGASQELEVLLSSTII